MTDETYVTKYLPIAWLDEVTPDSQKDVNAFLFQTETEQWAIKPVGYNEEESEGLLTIVFHGQIIPFIATRWYGQHVMTVDQNGKVWTPTVPEDANSFILANEFDYGSDTAQKLANGSGPDGPLPPGEYEIDAGFWDDAETRFRVVIEGETARFEPCAGAN